VPEATPSAHVRTRGTQGGDIMLRGVTVRFDTHDDAKDEETVVHVFIRNRWSNSLTPQKNTDFITDWFALY